jgi:hypothetical protein
VTSSGFTLEPREGYLYVQLMPGFEMDLESTSRVWVAICEACRERGLRRALVEGEGVTRRITPIEAFDIADLASRLLPGLSVACIFRGYVPDAQSHFFRTAAMKRGVRMEFFQDLNSALGWLGAGDRPPG